MRATMDKSVDDFINNNVQANGHKDQSSGVEQSCDKQEEQRLWANSSCVSSEELRKQQAAAGAAGATDAKPSIAREQPIVGEDNRERYEHRIKQLRSAGQGLRSDAEQPDLLEKPSWFEEDLFENAKSVYGRHFMGVNFAHLSGLLLLVRVSSIYRTLSVTGKSDSVAKLFNRYYQTVIHVKRWYEGDIFAEDSEAHRSLLIVRSMHNKVSSNLNDRAGQSGRTTPVSDLGDGEQTTPPQQRGGEPKLGAQPNANGTKLERAGEQRVHISQFDILLTQFAFVGFIVTRAKHVGLIDDFSLHDLDSLLHFWRVIGYYLGASDEFNLCARPRDEVIGLCEAIMEVEFKQSILSHPVSSPAGVMGVNIVRSIKFIPMLTIYGITKYLYELIHINTDEFEARATRYSRLSYTLIKLVMSRLLAYKGFRWFNNGLTRLSLFLVGKMEGTFAGHLDSKYGQELKL